jgi:hypothetical protein
MPKLSTLVFCQHYTILSRSIEASAMPNSKMGEVTASDFEPLRLLKLRAGKSKPRSDYLTTRGRLNRGPPGGSLPSVRESDLTPEEVAERLRTRFWQSVELSFLNWITPWGGMVWIGKVAR